MGFPESFMVQNRIAPISHTWPCRCSGVILLLTPVKDNFKDPDISIAKVAGADTWSITAIVVLLVCMFLIVTGAGYSVTYLMQKHRHRRFLAQPSAWEAF